MSVPVTEDALKQNTIDLEYYATKGVDLVAIPAFVGEGHRALPQKLRMSYTDRF